MAVLLRLVLLFWWPVLYHGRDGRRAGRQHLHWEEQGAALPLAHRHFQEHHTRHAPLAQLPLPTQIPLLVPFHRPLPLPRPLACRRRRGQELWPAPICAAFPGPHLGVHFTKPPLSLPHGPGWRRHLPLHVVPWPQTGWFTTHVWNGGQGHALPAPQLLPKGWRWRGSDDEWYTPLA